MVGDVTLVEMITSSAVNFVQFAGFDQSTLAVVMKAVFQAGLPPVMILVVMRAVFQAGLPPVMILVVMRVVEDEYLFLMMMMELDLSASQGKEPVATVIGFVVRALLDAGLI